MFKEIQKYINIFKDFLSDEPQAVKAATDIMLPVSITLIPVLTGVYKQSEDDSIKTLAISSITSALRASSPDEYIQKCTEYNEDPVFSNSIKEIYFSALTNENPQIRRFISTLLSFVISIEKKNAQELISLLIGELKSKDFNEFISASIIDIFCEIFKLPNFSDDLENTFLSSYNELLLFCQNEIIGEEKEIEKELRLSACNYVKLVIENCNELIQSAEMARDLLSSFENSLKIGDFDITEILHQNMFLMIQNFYDLSDEFMEIIFEHVKNNIIEFQIDHQLLIISIDFWCEVAKLEAQQNKKSDGICLKSFPELSDIFLDFLNPREPVLIFDQSQINENSRGALFEVLYDKLIEMIFLFSICIPPCIFDIISNRINEVLSQGAEDWEDAIYALGLFLSMTSPSMDKNQFCEFIFNYWDQFILFSAQPENSPEVRIMALSEIKNVLEYYPELITEMTPIVVDIDEQLNKIIGLMEIAITDQAGQIIEFDDRIIFLYAEIIECIGKLWKGSIHKSELTNEEIFKLYQNKIEEIFHFAIDKEYDNVIRAASCAISSIIENNFCSYLTDTYMIEWFKATLCEINDSEQIMDSKLRLIVQSEYCSIIGSFALISGINQNIMYELTDSALNMLDTFMEIQDFIFNDASLAVRNIINKYTDIGEQYAEKFLHICFDALKSEEPSTINSSCSLATVLFQKYYSMLNSAIPDMLEELLNLIENDDYLSPIQKNVLSSIGSILSSATEKPYSEFNSDFLENASGFDQRIFNVIQKVNDHVIYYNTTDQEIAYLTGILKCYRGYCIAYMFRANTRHIKELISSELNIFGDMFYSRERIQITVLHLIAKKILSKFNIFPINVITDFFYAFSIVSSRCSRKNNIMLRYANFKKLKDSALKLGNKKINDLIKLIDDHMKA